MPGSKIELPDDFQDKKKNSQVALRLHELGPRLKLKLIKIEEGLCRGNVVYHDHIKKSPADVKKQIDSLKNKRELKAKRKAIEEENVRKKKEKRGEITDEVKPDGESGDVKDEGEDSRALGKRTHS